MSMVVVDTSAAYFEGTEENGNVQAGTHARQMRQPGGLARRAVCHGPVPSRQESRRKTISCPEAAAHSSPRWTAT